MVLPCRLCRVSSNFFAQLQYVRPVPPAVDARLSRNGDPRAVFSFRFVSFLSLRRGSTGLQPLIQNNCSTFEGTNKYHCKLC